MALRRCFRCGGSFPAYPCRRGCSRARRKRQNSRRKPGRGTDIVDDFAIAVVGRFRPVRTHQRVADLVRLFFRGVGGAHVVFQIGEVLFHKGRDAVVKAVVRESAAAHVHIRVGDFFAANFDGDGFAVLKAGDGVGRAFADAKRRSACRWCPVQSSRPAPVPRR